MTEYEIHHPHAGSYLPLGTVLADDPAKALKTYRTIHAIPPNVPLRVTEYDATGQVCDPATATTTLPSLDRRLSDKTRR